MLRWLKSPKYVQKRAQIAVFRGFQIYFFTNQRVEKRIA